MALNAGGAKLTACSAGAGCRMAQVTTRGGVLVFFHTSRFVWGIYSSKEALISPPSSRRFDGSGGDADRTLV